MSVVILLIAARMESLFSLTIATTSSRVRVCGERRSGGGFVCSRATYTPPEGYKLKLFSVRRLGSVSSVCTLEYTAVLRVAADGVSEWY